MLIPVLVAIIIGISLVVIIMLVTGNKTKKDTKAINKIQKKGKSAILKEAERKLAHDPHNIPSLVMIGDIYFAEQDWEKTWNIYKTLYELSASHSEINNTKASARMGIAAYNLEKYDEALTSLMLALKKEPDNFEANYYLGKTFYKKDMYDKAILCLKKAKALQPDNSEPNEVIAQCFYKEQKYKEALPFLKRVLDEHPDNKELMYELAVAMSECGMADKALKVFIHLRPDPQYGPQSCLEAGKMHERIKDYQSALLDYEIALKLPNLAEQIGLQIRYRMANTYIQMNDISKGLVYLKQIQNIKNGYKDVDSLVLRYSELNQNKNLQTYLLSGTSDFIALCRKFIAIYDTENSFVKVEDVQVVTECVEIICSVENSKWDVKNIFRFYRTQNTIGDINIRDFHSKIRDSKCDNGICVTMGTFSESAHKFCEGRPIDLIEKEQLCKILKRINMLS